MSENQKNKEELIWTPVSCEHVVKDEWIDFRRMRYRFPDGREFEPYYNYSRRSYVVILAEDCEGRLLCVRQYRHGIGRVTVEFPAGGIETGGDTEYSEAPDAGSHETALEAAKRELREETGYVSDEWTHLLTIPSNPTLADNYAYLYVAKNCRPFSEQELDDTEYLAVERCLPEEVEEMIRSGLFAQPIHVLAWYMRLAGKTEQ